MIVIYTGTEQACDLFIARYREPHYKNLTKQLTENGWCVLAERVKVGGVCCP